MLSPISSIRFCSILMRSARSSSKGESAALTEASARSWGPQAGMLLCSLSDDKSCIRNNLGGGPDSSLAGVCRVEVWQSAVAMCKRPSASERSDGYDNRG